MAYLTVAVFNDETRAQQAMNELIRFYSPRPDLDNALLLTWRGSDPIAQLSQNLADRSGVGWGLLWGSLLGSVISDSGEIGASVENLRLLGARANDSVRSMPRNDLWTSGFHIPPDFFRDVAALITPGRSAIFFISRSTTLESVAKVTHGYGGTLLSEQLTAYQVGKMRTFVKANSSPH